MALPQPTAVRAFAPTLGGFSQAHDQVGAVFRNAANALDPANYSGSSAGPWRDYTTIMGNRHAAVASAYDQVASALPQVATAIEEQQEAQQTDNLAKQKVTNARTDLRNAQTALAGAEAEQANWLPHGHVATPPPIPASLYSTVSPGQAAADSGRTGPDQGRPPPAASQQPPPAGLPSPRRPLPAIRGRRPPLDPRAARPGEPAGVRLRRGWRLLEQQLPAVGHRQPAGRQPSVGATGHRFLLAGRHLRRRRLHNRSRRDQVSTGRTYGPRRPRRPLQRLRRRLRPGELAGRLDPGWFTIHAYVGTGQLYAGASPLALAAAGLIAGSAPTVRAASPADYQSLDVASDGLPVSTGRNGSTNYSDSSDGPDQHVEPSAFAANAAAGGVGAIISTVTARANATQINTSATAPTR